MPPVYGFVLPVATEGGAALHWCLGHFRKAFPDAPLTVISDGVQGLGYDKICKRFNATYVSGRYLKRIECGGQWWRRVLEEGVKTGADWIIKFDPDTKFHRAFRTPPPAATSPARWTTRASRTRTSWVVARRSAAGAAENILRSGILDDPALTDHRTFEPDEASRRHWKARSFMGSDISLRVDLPIARPRVD